MKYELLKSQATNRIVRHLAAAEGYLELSCPRLALVEIEAVPEPGAFAPIADLFRGEALQAQHRYAEAIDPLSRAAAVFPEPFSRRALTALASCYRGQGLLDLAAATDLVLSSKENPRTDEATRDPKTVPELPAVPMPIFFIQLGSGRGPRKPADDEQSS